MAFKAHPWIQWVIGPLLIVTATLVIVDYQTQLQRTRLRRDSLSTPYLYLVKLKRFAELGEAAVLPLDVTVTPDTSGKIVSEGGDVHTYIVTALDPSGAVRANSNKDIAIPILGFAISKEKRDEWDSLAADIQGAKKAIDPELYEHFQEVMDLHQQHPWPSVNNHEKIVTSDWNSKDLSGAWIDKNHRLKLLVQKELNLRNLPQT